jgi:hypothetical protein
MTSIILTSAAYVTAEDLFPALQSLLAKRELRFLVAPYSAWAQVRQHSRVDV